MAKSTLRLTLEELRRKLAEKETERVALDEVISDLKQGIKAIERVADSELDEKAKGDKPLATQTGFSNAVRFALKSARVELGPVEVKEKMEVLGYDFGRYGSDPLASIHTILKRLVKSGEATDRRLPDNRTKYKWVRSDQKGDTTDAPATNDGPK